MIQSCYMGDVYTTPNVGIWYTKDIMPSEKHTDSNEMHWCVCMPILLTFDPVLGTNVDILATSKVSIWNVETAICDAYDDIIVEVITGLRIPLDEYPVIYLDDMLITELDTYRFIDIFGGYVDG